MIPVTKLICIGFLCATASLLGQTAQDVEQEKRARTIHQILPTEGELAWQNLPWFESFGAGMMASDKLKKPLLLWVMNGHPLGCT